MSLKCPHCGKGVTLRLAASSSAPEFEPQPSGDVAQIPTVVAQIGAVEPQSAVVEGVRTSSSRAKYFYPDENFQLFWKVYPRKVGKASAFAKWRIAAREVEPQTIIDGAEAFAAYVKRERIEQRFILYPERWLGGGHWDDESHGDSVREDARYQPYDHEAHLRALEEI